MSKINILSRKIIFWFQVVLERQYTFRNSKASYTGVPVMAANMDTTGTFEIAKCFHDHGLFVCIHKHYRLKNVTVIFKIFFLTLKIHFHSLLNFFSVNEWKQFAKENPDVIKNIAVSSGTSDNDYEKIKVKESLQIKIIMRYYSCMYVFFGTFRLLLLLFLKLPSFAWTWQTVTLNTSCNTLEKFVRLLRLKP